MPTLKERIAALEAAVSLLTEALTDTVATLKELADRLDDLEEQGLISSAERNRLVETDLIVRARRDGQEVWVAVEVSPTVDVRDVERAAESAALLARTLGAPAAAAAAHDRGVLILSQA